MRNGFDLCAAEEDDLDWGVWCKLENQIRLRNQNQTELWKRKGNSGGCCRGSRLLREWPEPAINRGYVRLYELEAGNHERLTLFGEPPKDSFVVASRNKAVDRLYLVVSNSLSSSKAFTHPTC